jgi:hypothetical protein
VKRGEVCADKTNLTPPLFIEVPMPNQVMYLCVKGFDFVYLILNSSDSVVFLFVFSLFLFFFACFHFRTRMVKIFGCQLRMYVILILNDKLFGSTKIA